MTKQQPWMKWYPADWRAHTKLKMCSLSARGLWIEMLGIMHESEPYGHLLIDGAVPNIRDLAAIIGRPEKEVIAAYAELQHRGVFSKTDSGIPFSRKMVRDRAKVIENRENGADGGNPNIPRGTVPKEARSRPFKRSDAPNKTLRIFEMHDGHCHWCATELLYRPDGGPAGFHVDHVLAICDGGTNAESNLVPACAQCNHDRARLDAVGRQQQADATVTAWNTGVMVGIASDSKAQKPETRSQRPEKESAPPALDLGVEFEEWWAIYPRRESKGQAKKAFRSVRKSGVLLETLNAGARSYRDLPGREPKYTKLAATWLNGECWNDEAPTRPSTQAPAGALMPQQF